MEYCPSTLSKQVKENEGALTETQLKKVVRDVALGLNFLHKNDIVHLDIKTANILISENGIYKLGDMGCAKRLNEAGVSDGDDRYLAPEALSTSKEQQDEKKYDIYSLGVMLFELATNTNLVKHGETYKNVKGGDFHQLDSVDHLSESFKDLIRLMLDHDPKKRPTAQEILDKYVLSQEQIDLKWERIFRKALETEKEYLEQQYKSLQNRRRSIC